MVKMQVLYEGDLNTIVTHEPTGQTLHTDVSHENFYKRTFSPSDLIGAALGSCAATAMGRYAAKKGIDLRGMHLEIEKTMSTDAPKRVQHIKVEIWMVHPVPKAEQDALDKIAMACPVHFSLNPNIKIDTVIHWKD